MISIILPTHNRSSELEKCLNILTNQNANIVFEIIVVINNCSDNSRLVAEGFSNIIVVDEPNTAFSKARNTGARAANGDILLFLDDDAELWENSLFLASKLFSEEPKMGILAGRVEPRYEIEPPEWVVDCQKSHNALSLYRPNSTNRSGNVKIVEGAVGPCMAVRTNIYWQVGGFPPDTIGVESNAGKNNFAKWYIGPGDYGLCELVKKTEHFIGYHDNFGVDHVIPPYRLTPQFWISRFYGEGIYEAISEIEFWKLSRKQIFKNKLLGLFRFYIIMAKLNSRKGKHQNITVTSQKLEMIKLLSYLVSLNLFVKHPVLTKTLWNMGAEGVPDKDFQKIRDKIPNNFLKLAEPDFNEIADTSNPAKFLIKRFNLSLLFKFPKPLKLKIARNIEFMRQKFLYRKLD